MAREAFESRASGAARVDQRRDARVNAALSGWTPKRVKPSKTWAWRSIRPGVTTVPGTSMTRRASSGGIAGAMLAIAPCSIATSHGMQTDRRVHHRTAFKKEIVHASSPAGAANSVGRASLPAISSRVNMYAIGSGSGNRPEVQPRSLETSRPTNPPRPPPGSMGGNSLPSLSRAKRSSTSFGFGEASSGFFGKEQLAAGEHVKLAETGRGLSRLLRQNGIAKTQPDWPRGLCSLRTCSKECACS